MTAVNRTRLRRWFVAATLSMTACRLSDDEFQTLHTWLTCDDCTDGSRAAIEAMDWKVVARLEAALVAPSPGRQAVMRTKFGESYDQARVQARVAALTRRDYVEFRAANYVATYQKRAAISLGDIGGRRAKRALDKAIADTSRHYRQDVLRVIQFARAKLNGRVFNGAVSPYQVSFGEVITVVAPTTDPFTGDEHAVIEGGPFPVNQTPHSVVGDTLRLMALADLGPHILSIANAGSGDDTENVGVFVTSLVDANDRAMVRCPAASIACAVDSAPPIMFGRTTGFTTFLTLWREPSPGDTLDYFRFRNTSASSLPLTAQLDWHGRANLDLLWRKCAPYVSTGNADGATLSPVEQSSVSVPPGECWILEISLRRGKGAGPAFARLRVRSP